VSCRINAPMTTNDLRDYTTLGVIGSGTNATVCKLEHKITKKHYAYKKYKSEFQTFAREVAMLNTLNHPYIVHPEKIVSFPKAGTKKWERGIVLPLYDGDLRKLVEKWKHSRLAGSAKQAHSPKKLHIRKRLCFQLCLAFQHLCHHGTLHRDLKPENVLYRTDDSSIELAICDFGIGRVFVPSNVDEEITPTVQTLWNRAAEIIFETGHYDFASDVWSLGLIMLYLFTGTEIKGRSKDTQLLAILHFCGFPDFWQGLSTLERVVGKDVVSKFVSAYRKQQPQLQPWKDYWTSLEKQATLADLLQLHFCNSSDIEFFRAVLQLDPRSRLNCDQMLAHAFFDDVRSGFPTVLFPLDDRLKILDSLKRRFDWLPAKFRIRFNPTFPLHYYEHVCNEDVAVTKQLKDIYDTIVSGEYVDLPTDGSHDFSKRMQAVTKIYTKYQKKNISRATFQHAIAMFDYMWLTRREFVGSEVDDLSCLRYACLKLSSSMWDYVPLQGMGKNMDVVRKEKRNRLKTFFLTELSPVMVRPTISDIVQGFFDTSNWPDKIMRYVDWTYVSGCHFTSSPIDIVVVCIIAALFESGDKNIQTTLPTRWKPVYLRCMKQLHSALSYCIK
jgi:serine/threonine protein kinase